MNYKECLAQLREKTKYTQNEMLSIRIKPIPDDERRGVPDPRVLLASKNQKPYPAPKIDKQPTISEIKTIRNWMGCDNKDLSVNVSKTVRIIQTDDGEMPVYCYDPGGNADRPAVIYIHGGAFYAGTTGVVENACKLLAQRSGALVLSLDYALAPEHKFPAGLMQCWQAVNWVYKHASELSISPDRIAIMGDSAGGNLAAACSMLDQSDMIKLQILLYPCVQLDPDHEEWDETAYEVNAEYAKLLESMIHATKDSSVTMNAAYVDDAEKLKNPLISPLLSKDLSSMPTTMIVTAEYDYLRQQGLKFAKRLSEDGVDTILYMYQGMGHSFFEHTGEFPQAEDCTEEAAEAIKSI